MPAPRFAPGNWPRVSVQARCISRVNKGGGRAWRASDADASESRMEMGPLRAQLTGSHIRRLSRSRRPLLSGPGSCARALASITIAACRCRVVGLRSRLAHARIPVPSARRPCSPLARSPCSLALASASAPVDFRKRRVVGLMRRLAMVRIPALRAGPRLTRSRLGLRTRRFSQASRRRPHASTRDGSHPRAPRGAPAHSLAPRPPHRSIFASVASSASCVDSRWFASPRSARGPGSLARAASQYGRMRAASGTRRTCRC